MTMIDEISRLIPDHRVLLQIGEETFPAKLKKHRHRVPNRPERNLLDCKRSIFLSNQLLILIRCGLKQ